MKRRLMALVMLLMLGSVFLPTAKALADQQTDVMNGKYGFSADKTQIVAMIGGQTVIFNSSGSNHHFVASSQPFCTPGSGANSVIDFSPANWSSNPPKGSAQVYVVVAGGACIPTNQVVQVATTIPAASVGGDSVASGTVSSSATTGSPCSAGAVSNSQDVFFFLPHWWQFMPPTINTDNGPVPGFTIDALGQCQPNFQFPQSIFPVGLAALDILLRIAGFATVIAVLISGIMYMTGQGNPDRGSAARRALFNALIGMGIVFAATAIVTFVGNKLAQCDNTNTVCKAGSK